MDNEKTHVFTKDEWYAFIDGGIDFSMNDIDNADEDGFIGWFVGRKCYVKKDVVDKNLNEIEVEGFLFDHFPADEHLKMRESCEKIFLEWHNTKILEVLEKMHKEIEPVDLRSAGIIFTEIILQQLKDK